MVCTSFRLMKGSSGAIELLQRVAYSSCRPGCRLESGGAPAEANKHEDFHPGGQTQKLSHIGSAKVRLEGGSCVVPLTLYHRCDFAVACVGRRLWRVAKNKAPHRA